MWVRLNHAGRILLSTGEESDIDTDLSPLGHDLEEDRIGYHQLRKKMVSATLGLTGPQAMCLEKKDGDGTLS